MKSSVAPTGPPVLDPQRSTPIALRWLAVIAGSAAIIATYWDGAWHSEIGRDSTFAPPHVLLYSSIAAVALIIAAWVVVTLVRERSVLSVLRHRALVLTGVALAMVALSAALDVLWHEYFGRDSVLWSPPHLLGIIGSVVVVVGVTMSGDRGRPLRSADVALGAVLLGTAMLPVMEYDSRVPQFSEVLYLPVALAAALFAAWVIIVALSGARVMTVIVGCVVALRAAVWGVLTLWGWPAVDVPIALLGLAVLDLPRARKVDRFALAAIAMSSIQLVASAVGLSSVQAETVLPAAIIVIAIAGGVMLISRGRQVVVATLATLALAATLVSVDPLPASAHDPGQGTEQGEVAMTVERVGSTVSITVEVVSSSTPLRFERIVARRAGQNIQATLEQGDTSGLVVRGTLELTEGDLWFIYAEFSSSMGALESWIIVEPNDSRTEVRPLYEPPVSPVNDLEFIGASAALYGLAASLIWVAILTVREPRRMRSTRSSAE